MANGLYLTSDHFAGQVDVIARDLIGRRLIVRDGGVARSALIVETEAYGDAGDPASHAAFRAGGRAASMFGPPGGIYVYAAYGVYPCFNIVTGTVGVPSAVLLRSAWIDGEPRVTSGPGRLTRALGITIDDHGRIVGDGRFDITVARTKLAVQATPRIGITRGIDTLWRFIGSPVEDRAT